MSPSRLSLTPEPETRLSVLSAAPLEAQADALSGAAEALATEAAGALSAVAAVTLTEEQRRAAYEEALTVAQAESGRLANALPWLFPFLIVPPHFALSVTVTATRSWWIAALVYVGFAAVWVPLLSRWVEKRFRLTEAARDLAAFDGDARALGPLLHAANVASSPRRRRGALAAEYDAVIPAATRLLLRASASDLNALNPIQKQSLGALAGRRRLLREEPDLCRALERAQLLMRAGR
jgi:hypothetical protein